MYEQFSLVLMVTHACNLRCGYCYVGRKSARVMSPEIWHAAIDRALRSIHEGGALDLSFFGGEPLEASEYLLELLAYAENACNRRGISLRPHLTTNGTHSDAAAWKVMTWRGLSVSVSHDGLPEIHDLHRRDANGRATSATVLNTIARLLDADREVNVAMVVRPDNAAMLADGIVFLQNQGVRHFNPSLDLWTRWTDADLLALENALIRCAEVWRDGLPQCGIGWFDEKAARLLGLPIETTPRCGFGDGELAVAPSGNLYPCERLIGADLPDDPMRLPGHVLDGDCFTPHVSPLRNTASCAACAIGEQCGTICRCSNYVRTGDVSRPDGLLCLLERVCRRETSRMLRSPRSKNQFSFVPVSESIG